jgi:acyl-CoA synthetase (AMP-forming)/AMP-acid ligase II
MTLVLGHPDVLISAHYVSQLLKQGVITALLSPPSILDELSKDPYSVPELAKLQHIGYAGGPMSPETGKTLAPLLPHFFSFIGATEYGWFHCISGGSERWSCLKFVQGIGYRFDEVSNGIFELVIVKDSKTDKYHGIFEVFPDITEYRTRDLYELAGDGWWQYKGRTDDLIVLSNGEKINPIPMEHIIQSHPSVKAALVVGDHRFNPSLLVEMEDNSIPQTKAEKRDRLNQIWPTVEEANKVAPEFAKIPKSLILFATAEKPFLRAGKGTVQRQNTVKSYVAELDALFASQEDSLLTEGLTLGKLSSQESIIKTFTREIYAQALAAKDLGDDDDVFERGMDSLHVELIVQRLRAALKATEAPLDLQSVDTRLVYSATSVNQMAEALVGMIARSGKARISSKL